VEIYETQDQQLQAIKQFLVKHQKLFAIVITIVVISVVSGGYWRHHTQVQSVQASDLYQEMLAADFQQQHDSVVVKGKKLMDEFSDTPYSQLAALLLAKGAVAEDSLDKAEEYLHWVIKQSASKDLSRHIATERLARVMQQRGNTDAALTMMLAAKADSAYETLFQEIIGDLYLAKGDLKQAKAAYINAITKVPTGAQIPLLQMKLMDLGVSDAEIQELQGEHPNA
jgi:predicted negative regulator of RcsB-dependent stress response